MSYLLYKTMFVTLITIVKNLGTMADWFKAENATSSFLKYSNCRMFLPLSLVQYVNAISLFKLYRVKQEGI